MGASHEFSVGFLKGDSALTGRRKKQVTVTKKVPKGESRHLSPLNHAGQASFGEGL